MMALTKQYGWECPKCGKVWAPWIPDCKCTEMGTMSNPQGPSFLLCLKCHGTYPAGQVHTCVTS